MFDDGVIKGCIVWRIDVVDAAAQDGDGAGFQGRRMSAGIDTARQTGHDHKAGLTQLLSQDLRHLLAGGRGIAGADQGDGLA